MSIQEKINQMGEWTKKNQADMALVVGFVLVALVSFGIGYLSAPGIQKSPLKIENMQSGIGETLINVSAGDSAKAALDQAAGQSQKGIIVASKYGTKYHWPWCSFAKNIKPENQVWFKSEAEAQAAGYTACGCIKSKAPAGYMTQ